MGQSLADFNDSVTVRFHTSNNSRVGALLKLILTHHSFLPSHFESFHKTIQGRT